MIGKVDYGGLEGLEVASCAREAGERALAGEVPTRSKDGNYEVATFAGGCFWGTSCTFSGSRASSPRAWAMRRSARRADVRAGVQRLDGPHRGLQLYFDPAVVTYELLVEKLLATVDPTALNRVGNDRGLQLPPRHLPALGSAARRRHARLRDDAGDAQPADCHRAQGRDRLLARRGLPPALPPEGRAVRREECAGEGPLLRLIARPPLLIHE